MADTRNFRSAYLGKVGIKGVEEKKSLEILLKEQPLDINKLSHFSLLFPLPAAYRPFIWKVILGISPPYKEAQDFVSQQRNEQYNDLLEAINAMKRVNDESQLPDTHLRMFLIEEGMLPLDDNKVASNLCSQSFIAISSALMDVLDNPIEIYWLSTKFYQLNQRHEKLVPLMVELVEFYTKREEQEDLIKLKKSDGEELKYYGHLTKTQAFKCLPFSKWFYCSFAKVLPETSFERIWDKVIGGSSCILVFVAVAMLLTFKRPLSNMNNVEEMQKYLSLIHEDSGDIIVGKALELWQKNGSPLLASAAVTRGESPKPIVLDRVAPT